MTDLSKRYLYRMLHIENIPHILTHGITHRDSPNRNPDFMPIGDGRLIDKRANRPLPNQRQLGEYIPFYFGPRMPMLYTIQHGYSGVRSVLPEKIVYCITSVADVMACSSVDFMFTDGHAIEAFSSFYGPENLSDLEQLLDMEAISAKYWTDDNDPTSDLKRRKQAEFLVLGDLPPTAVRGYFVYNEAAQAKLLGFGIEERRVVVRPAYYF